MINKEIKLSAEDKICPKCGELMVEGFLAGGGLGIAFYPGERKSGFSSSFRMLRMFFSRQRIFRYIGTEAKCCPHCREITFSY